MNAGKNFTFWKTKTFDKWFGKIKDPHSFAEIADAILTVELGDFRRCTPIKKKAAKGIFEIVIDFGPGFRLYYCREGKMIYWLLIGGIKKSQDRDIDYAIELRRRGREIGYDKV